MFKEFLLQIIVCAASLLIASGPDAWATAYTIDLTNPTASTTINTAIFAYDNISSGSGGYTDMFRVQNTGTESGYNYTGALTPLPFDQKGGIAITQVDLGVIPIVTIGGVQYLRFNFDANNSNGLTLTDFRMYIASDPANTNTAVYVTSEANLNQLGTLIYDFNAGGANSLQMTAFKSGSGTDDMSINIPVSLVYGRPFNANDNVSLWVKMTNGDGGFEELAIDKSLLANYGGLLPEAKTVWGGAGMALLLVGSVIQQRRKVALAAATSSAAE